MVSIVRPFIKNWTGPWEGVSNKIGFEEWLFVAWTFGYPKIFKPIMDRLVLNTTTNAGGQCLNEKKTILDQIVTPPDVIGKFAFLHNLELPT